MRATAIPSVAAILAALASSSFAGLTLLPAGPQIGTHAGNLVATGSFEAGPPGAVVLWATGTSGTPYVPIPNWTSSGVAANYARWGHDSVAPLNIAGSADIPDGVKALYFGNGQGAHVNVAPNFQSDGEVTFATAPIVTTSIGAPVTLAQTINTHLSVAPSYILSFWVSGEGASGGGAYDGIFGLRVTNTQLGDPMRYFTVPAGGALTTIGDQRRFEFSFTPINPAAPVSIEFYNWGHFNLGPFGLGGTTELVLDDVIVNPVPAPGFGVLALAGGVLAGRRRHR